MFSVYVDIDGILRSSWFTKYFLINLFLPLELEKTMLYRANIYKHKEFTVQLITNPIRGITSRHSACE